MAAIQASSISVRTFLLHHGCRNPGLLHALQSSPLLTVGGWMNSQGPLSLVLVTWSLSTLLEPYSPSLDNGRKPLEVSAQHSWILVFLLMRPNSTWVIIVWPIPRHLILKAPQVKCFMFMLHKRQWSAIYNDRICLCLGGKISIFRNLVKKELLSNLLTGTSLLKGARCLILLRRKYYSSLNDLISVLFDNFRDGLLSNSRSSSRLRN